MKYNTPASGSAGEVCLALDALHATDYTLHSLHTAHYTAGEVCLALDALHATDYTLHSLHTAHYTAHTTRVEAYRSRSLLLLLLLQRLLLWLPLSLPRGPFPQSPLVFFFLCVPFRFFFFVCVFFCVCFFLNVFCFKAC